MKLLSFLKNIFLSFFSLQQCNLHVQVKKYFRLQYKLYVKTYNTARIENLTKMIANRRKNSNYDDIQAGQTLFDFLKRKKKFALSTSLSKSRNKENNSYESNLKEENKKDKKSVISPHKKYEDTYRETLRQSKVGYSSIKPNEATYRSAAYGQMNTTTPKRVSPADQLGKQRKTSARNSFIQMISPMTKRSALCKTPDNHINTLEASFSKERKSNNQQHFYRKNLNKSVSILKGTLQKFISAAASIKQKSHFLHIQLKPLLKWIEQIGNTSYTKRAQQIKLKLRTLQHLFKQFSIQNGNDIIEQFHKSLSQHLISYESNIRQSFQKQKDESFNRLKKQKDERINYLENLQQKYEKQIEIMNRKLQKSQKQAQKQIKTSHHNYSAQQKSYNSKIAHLQQVIKDYQMQINNLAKQLDISKQNQKQLQKSVKDWKYLKQEAQKKFIEQNSKVKSSKEQFLLNELSILKKQFKNDMEQLTTLFSAKQDEHLCVIAQLKQQIIELHKQIQLGKEIEQKLLSDISIFKNQYEKSKKQNECLVTDLHRMNQQLYQHWLALKDIKTLAARLQIINKFSKIYEDLAFNDQLFI